MRQAIIDQDILLALDERLIKRLWKVDKTEYFPDGLEFAFQYLYFDGNGWVQVARIDNQLHRGKPGTHIHILKREKVSWEQMAFEEAEKRIIEIGKSIIKNIIAKV